MTPPPPERTIQELLDEIPSWPDGTSASSPPMTRMQRRIWLLATAGKFFEGFVVFITGVALPLIVAEFGLNGMEKGTVGAASLLGILVGASALGGLSDHFGRKRMFIAEMLLFALCLALLVLSPSYAWLVAALFGVGLALGCDYPTAHMVISESISSAHRGRLVLAAFGAQAIGALAGTAVGFLVLYERADVSSWRAMYATAVIPAVLVGLARFFITDSPHWLAARGRLAEAERETLRLLRRDPPYPTRIRLARPEAADEAEHTGFSSLFNRQNRRATILASVPWFLQDLSTYGIGIFTPTILATVLGAQTVHVHNISAVIAQEMYAAKGAAFIDVFLLLGIVAAVLLVDRAGRIPMQVVGFVGCAAGLGLAALSLDASGEHQTFLLFGGFMLFSLMTNAGPNAMTYALSGEVFPTSIRGKGAGFAASAAKVGAVLTAFCFPILLKSVGTEALLWGLVGSSLLGAAVTWFFRIETKGINLETVGKEPPPGDETA